MIFHNDEQGSEEWLEARRGVITGSRFKDARERTAKGAMGSKAALYAKDVARERFGGKAADVYQNAAMRTGTEQEPIARQFYEARSGNMVEEAGFITTDDCKFGVSVDGLVDDDGIIEIKTMVSSNTLFTAVVDEDHSEYIDQINGAMWLLGRKWCDLILWAPDLPVGRLTIVRINRNDDDIQKLEDDLMAFERHVSALEQKLRDKLAPRAAAPADDSPPWAEPSAPTPAKASTELVADPFA